MYYGTFKVKKQGDVYLNMTNWDKGIVYVNGHNLGRYWNVGPQQTLYLPGCWLKKGHNEIVIFDQENTIQRTQLETTSFPILEKLQH